MKESIQPAAVIYQSIVGGGGGVVVFHFASFWCPLHLGTTVLSRGIVKYLHKQIMAAAKGEEKENGGLTQFYHNSAAAVK